MSSVKEHLAAVDEGYFEHMGHALNYSGRLFLAASACVIHAFVPSRCTSTASLEISRLHAEIAARKSGANE